MANNNNNDKKYDEAFQQQAAGKNLFDTFRKMVKHSKRWKGTPIMETGQDQMDILIGMNDLQNLIKDFESSKSALSGLETWSGSSAGKETAEKVFSILEGQEMYYPKWRPGMTAEEQEPFMEETPWDIGDIVSAIEEGKAYKDKQPPQIGAGGIGGSMQGEPEKMKGIMALLQRLFPGGKTGYR